MDGDLYVPMKLEADQTHRYDTKIKLKPGVAMAAAETEFLPRPPAGPSRSTPWSPCAANSRTANTLANQIDRSVPPKGQDTFSDWLSLEARFGDDASIENPIDPLRPQMDILRIYSPAESSFEATMRDRNSVQEGFLQRLQQDESEHQKHDSDSHS
jgi:hypothetical protein